MRSQREKLPAARAQFDLQTFQIKRICARAAELYPHGCYSRPRKIFIKHLPVRFVSLQRVSFENDTLGLGSQEALGGEARNGRRNFETAAGAQQQGCK